MSKVDTTKKFRVWNGYNGMHEELFATIEEANDAAMRYHEGTTGRQRQYNTLILETKGYVETPAPDYKIVTV